MTKSKVILDIRRLTRLFAKLFDFPHREQNGRLVSVAALGTSEELIMLTTIALVPTGGRLYPRLAT